MHTLIYSPGVRILVATLREGIIEVTDDVVRGSLSLNENAPHQFRFSLLNHRRKYDGVFTPNDRIVVRLKRLRWLLNFSGYLNSVPYFSVYPRTVPLGATCTLKRVQFRPWDPGAMDSVDLFNNAGVPEGAFDRDGGIKRKAVTLLKEVCQWPEGAIHIGEVPANWIDRVEQVWKAIGDDISPPSNLIGTSATVNGTDPSEGPRAGTSNEQGPGYGQLPATQGKASYFATPSGDAPHGMALSGESGLHPNDPWYCAMRWPYRTPDLKSYLSRDEEAKAKSWWNGRRILVVNPKNNLSVVLRAADWGPNIKTGKVIDMSKYALETVLGAVTNDVMNIFFAPDGLPLGPVTAQPSRGPATPPHPITEASHTVDLNGVKFTSADHLKPNAAAARQFIKDNWNTGFGIGGYATGGHVANSDHYKGLALDAMISSGEPNAQQKAMGNSIALWFIQNPQAFGVKYVIWYNRINTGTGWRPYRHPGGGTGTTLMHRDHVHISFLDPGPTSLGPMGGAWPGATAADMEGGVASISPVVSGGTSGGAGGGNFITAYDWQLMPNEESEILAGPRALMNDEWLLPTIDTLMKASMRHYCSAPNGDFIAWFPDYFGIYGTAGKMVIQDIEIAEDGFTVMWDDTSLRTHFFTAGSYAGIGGLAEAGQVTAYNKFQTVGIASVEFPEIMDALFNLDRDDPVWKDAKTILDRFGARPEYEEMAAMTTPEAEFWYALSRFQENWANQFTASLPLTWMPEVFPGMLLQVPSVGVQVYCTSVTHSFDLAGGGFDTNVQVIAPSTTDSKGLKGLPRGGRTFPSHDVNRLPAAGSEGRRVTDRYV